MFADNVIQVANEDKVKHMNYAYPPGATRSRSRAVLGAQRRSASRSYTQSASRLTARERRLCSRLSWPCEDGEVLGSATAVVAVASDA